MKRFYSTSRLLTLLLLPWLLLCCIDEEASPCPTLERQVSLGFVFTPEGENDILPTDLSTIEVFIFNEWGMYVGNYIDTHPRMQEAGYRIPLSLEPGNYSFIAWGNMGTQYNYTPVQPLVKEITSKGNAMISLVRPANDTITTTISHLFHGKMLQVTIDEQAEQTVIMPLVQNTYTIHVDVVGLNPTAPACLAVITDNNSDYDFNNTTLLARSIHYTSRSLAPGYAQRVSLRTLRLTTSSQARLKVYAGNAAALLYDDALLNLIEAANHNGASLDFNRIHTYYIRLEFDATSGAFNVTINGWNTNTQTDNIHPQA